MTTWFTADTHFGHANIIRYCGRPQLKDGDEIENSSGQSEWCNDQIRREHDEFIITRWNERVKPGDVVYHAGDFAFGRTVEDILYYFRRLNGSIHLIYGNHDRCKIMKKIPFAWQGDRKSITIDKQRIVIDHYAGRVWDGSHDGVWQLYGHTHGTLPDDPRAFSLDVGVDSHNYYPISFSEIKEIMSKKQSV